MAVTEHLKDKPAGFKNRIEKVAIVGVSPAPHRLSPPKQPSLLTRMRFTKATGQLGKHFTEHLLRTGKHTITAITRNSSSTAALPAGVIPAQVDYDKPETVQAALAGQDALIITLARAAAPTTQGVLLRAAAAAGVAYVMPNIYGPNPVSVGYAADIRPGYERVAALRAEMEALGLRSLTLACGFWYEYSLSRGREWYGFDFARREVDFVDDGNTPISTTTFPQCGRAVAALLSLPVLPADEKDVAPTLAKFAGDVCWVSSFCVSQRDMLESAKRVTGTTDADWTITRTGHAERFAAGKKRREQGDPKGYAQLLYTRVFYPDGDGSYHDGRDNDALGLPKEDLDEWTAVGIKMAMEGEA